jgi:tail protein P2 I
VQVRDFKAESNSRGGRIDLSWINPAAAEFPGFKGVRILRRESTQPETAIQGGQSAPVAPAQIVFDSGSAAPGASGAFSDQGLNGETVYYYAAVAYSATQVSPPAFASALATTPYQTADELYRELPGFYRQFDTVTPPDVPGLDPAAVEKGQLRRAAEMFGEQFDLLRSYARAMRDFQQIDRIDGALLPLLAEWIGWQNDFTLNHAKQRNEISYAPHFHRTTGIAANLRATINRLTTCDAQVKEFVHNIFLTNAPEQLIIKERERIGAIWQAERLVTTDIAYEGRPAATRSSDGRLWLFYHARQSAVKPATDPGKTVTENQWHLWFKTFDQTGWLPAQRLTFDGKINKYPAAFQKKDGNFWLFFSSYEEADGGLSSRIKLHLVSAGRPAQPPRVSGALGGPFNFTDGDQLILTITTAAGSIARTVTLRQENFNNLAQAPAPEIAAFLDRELPGVRVAAEENGAISITSLTTGAASKLIVQVSPVATRLGLVSGTELTVVGSDAASAQLIGDQIAPFALASGDRLNIQLDDRLTKTITFDGAFFANIAQATADEVVAVINRALPGLAMAESGKIKLVSSAVGETSFVAIDVTASAAAPKLGFGAPSISATSPAPEDTEPAAFEDNAGNVWLFWRSRSDGAWKIWYNRFNGTAWGISQRLTAGTDPEFSPAVVFDPASDKIWVFWSRQKSNGLWNISYRTSTNMNFPTSETELELAPVPSNYDRQEPAAALHGADNVELYFSSNRTDGWQVWTNTLTPTPSADETPITAGQFTHRAPAAVITTAGAKVWFRCNESQVYVSPSYPASQTIDARYAGSTTVDTRNPVKFGLRGNLHDATRYTYDTGRAENDWYARDTVGIYLAPATLDEQLVIRKQTAIANVIRDFLPIQVRAVFIIQLAQSEYVYTYSVPNADPPQLIGERVIDTILGEHYTGLTASFRDLVSFHFVRTWSPAYPQNTIPDLRVTPPDLSFRLFMRGVEERS